MVWFGYDSRLSSREGSLFSFLNTICHCTRQREGRGETVVPLAFRPLDLGLWFPGPMIVNLWSVDILSPSILFQHLGSSNFQHILKHNLASIYKSIRQIHNWYIISLLPDIYLGTIPLPPYISQHNLGGGRGHRHGGWGRNFHNKDPGPPLWPGQQQLYIHTKRPEHTHLQPKNIIWVSTTSLKLCCLLQWKIFV